VFRNIGACLWAGGDAPDQHRDHRVVMGVDWGKQADFTVLSVVCAECGKELAIDRFNKIDYAFQRKRLAALAEKWGVSYISAESNAMGEPVIEQLQRDGLPVYGFQTTASSKPPLIESLALALEREEVTWLDDPTAKAELEAYERKTSGTTGRSSYSAPEGMHDDTVIARAQKAVSLADFDDFLDWMVDQGGEEDGKVRLSTAMQKVAFVYRCIRLVSDAVRNAPFRISPVGSDDDWDSSQDYQNKLGILPNPKRTVELVTRSLLGPGRAYLFKTEQGRTFKELRYMVASTIKPKIDGSEGLVGFVREVNGNRTVYDPERFVWFWPADETVELGPPKSSPVQAALQAAGANYFTAKFISDFFARGAIKGTLLAVKGNPVESERQRLKDWFRKTFFGGSGTSWSTEIINADVVEPVKIGEGLESLNNNELTRQMREDIAVALGVPMSKLLSSTVAGLGGGGVAESDDVGFYADTVRPLGDFIADTLNAQLLRPMGYQWQWLWDTLDVFQTDEKARSVAFKTYVDSGMLPHIAAYMLGIEIPKEKDVPSHYIDSFEEKKEPEAFGLPGQGDEEEEEDESDMSQEQQAEYQREREATVRNVDLDKWERMASKRFDEGHPEKALDFETDLIQPGLAAGIRMALEQCETSEEVKAMFGRVQAAQEWQHKRGALESVA